MARNRMAVRSDLVLDADAGLCDSYRDFVDSAVARVIDQDPNLGVLIDDDPDRFTNVCNLADAAAVAAIVTTFPVVITPHRREDAVRCGFEAARRVVDAEMSSRKG